MTIELPDGTRILVYRDGAPVTDDDSRPRPVRLNDLDPTSQRIVLALIDAADAAHRTHGGEGRREACGICTDRQRSLRGGTK